MNFQKKFSKKIITIALSCLVVIFLWSVPRSTQAQFAVFDPIVAGWTSATTLGQKIADIARYAYEKGGALAFQKALRSALNKIAMDSATYIASGDKGQKPLFNNKPLGQYFAEIADEAAGEFIENFVNNWNVSTSDQEQRGLDTCSTTLKTCQTNCPSPDIPDPYADTELDPFNDYLEELNICQSACLVEYQKCQKVVVDKANQATTTPSSARPVNVCQPSSLAVKLQISLGLVDSVRPRAPSCTASKMVRNWSDEIARMDPRTWNDRAWLNNLSGIFDPVQNDLGIALNLQSDFGSAQSETLKTKERAWLQEGRWLDVVGISGKVESLPGQAKMEAEINQTSMRENLAKYTGDAFIDAANIFINTLAIQAYNRLMQGFGKTVDSTSSQTASLSDPNADPNIRYGDVTVAEKISQILSPVFSRQANYNIANDLSICPDQNNPGPTNCVIDSSFMQAINEQQTVIEAILSNNLKKDWILTSDNNQSDAYTLRNIVILRKYRIIPLGWEVAAQANQGATLMDLVSCFDANDDYQEYSSTFNTGNMDWCRGLVDPNWVLKAPINLCEKQGAGNQILSTNISPGQPASTGMGTIPSTLNITRAEDYCADEKTCIKEATDGSCLFYGYCNEEKRIWTFGDGLCQPINNTCQSFTSSSGQVVSYLENTLDYGNCDEDSAGCREYLLTGSYSLDDNKVNWNYFPNAYFNNNLTSCSPNNEGCTELMRVRPAWGSNLIMGANFQYDEISETPVSSGNKINNYWPIGGVGQASIVDGVDLGYPGQRMIRLSGNDVSLDSNQYNSLLPTNFPIIPGYSYTFTADVYMEAGDGLRLFVGNKNTYVESTNIGSWQRLSKTFTVDPVSPQISNLNFGIQANPSLFYSGGEYSIFYVVNPKLEINTWASDYSPYGAYKFYQKLIPPYLAAVCYEDGVSATKDYRLKSDAPAICFNYTRQCNKNEVGCNLFTSVRDGFSVPAKVSSTDYCPADCNTYDIYIAQENHFNSPIAENMIPATAQKCSADFVGCTEFTNLDRLEAGGESREYYSFLKHCIKPDDTCGNFYTWEGNEDSGYQLRVMTLKRDGAHPALTSPDSTCNQTTYFLPPWDPQYNSDCRQFYNQAGVASYRLMSRTITCSDNCNIYRMTEKNIDSSLTQAQCTGSDKNWDTSLSVCHVCKNGGIWNSVQNACLYQGIPGEGKICQASMDGCREYTGKLGSNTRLIAAYNFEGGTAGFEGRCNHSLESSSVAISDNGMSLKYLSSGSTPCPTEEDNNLGRIQLPVGNNVRQGFSYSIRFLARADSAATIYFAFRNQDGLAGENKFEPLEINLPGNSEWRIYDLNLPAITHAVDDNEVLYIRSTGDFYIDDIIISEIQDRYYLIQNSGQVPDICYYDIFDEYRGADYNLGCSQWRDQNNVSHYLRRFTQLCQESSIGCELMIDTANQTDWRPKTVCSADDTSCLDVPVDNFIYAKYDSSKLCAATDKGCSLMAEVSGQGSGQVTNNVFKKNNPDNYSSSLCSSSAVGCKAWTSSLGTRYFKDPVFNTCVYRHGQGSVGVSKQWYRSPVNRCDLNENGQISGNERTGDICQTDDDCASGSCILDTNDYLCSVSYFKTIGLGGANGRIPVPDAEVGICDAFAAGCSEYIDPISQFSPNLVTSNWTGSGVQTQTIQLTPNTLYMFANKQSNGFMNLSFDLDVRLLGDDNQFLETTTDGFTIDQDREKIIYFHSQLNTQGTLTGSLTSGEIEVKPVVVSYQLRQNLDLQDCTTPNFNSGCILFNERTVQGSGEMSALNIKAASSYEDRNVNACSVNSDISKCNANELIKVRPDRVCSRWLDCMTYTEDPETGDKVCYDLGECVALNDRGECISFTSFNNQLVSQTAKSFDNITGYSLLDRYYVGDMKEVGLNTDIHYDFESQNIALHCKRLLEIRNDVPGHGSYPDKSLDACSFNSNIVKDSLVQEPTGAPTDYPAEGKGFLKVLAYHQISPHAENFSFSLESGTDYYLHYLVNTKNSNIDATVVLSKQSKNEIVFSASTPANNGWERKIHRINLSGTDTEDLQLYLTAKARGEEELYVYFDDIHIEPVLQAGPDEYIAKECRLYPEISSLSCRSQEANVIKHGLEGYCLVRDPKNTDICLMWYPLDNIRSTNLTAGLTTGYQGKTPLYYCAEANADFYLLEKRMPVKVASGKHTIDGGMRGHFGVSTQDVDDDFCNPTNSSRPAYCVQLHNKKSVCALVASWRCSKSLGELGSGYDYQAIYESDGTTANIYCVPRLDKISPEHWSISIVPQGPIANRVPLPNSLGICNQLTDSQWNSMYLKNGDVFEYPMRPSAGVNLSAGIYEIWDVYDGLFYFNYNKDPQAGYGDCNDCNLTIDESTNHNPPVAIFDLNTKPESEEDLKFIYHNDPLKVYDLTCNRFVQTVDFSGANKAWSNRVSPLISSLDTPSFMLESIKDSQFYNSSVPPGNQCVFKEFEPKRWFCETEYDEEYDYYPMGCESGVPDYCDQDSSGNCDLEEDIDNYCANKTDAECTDSPYCDLILAINVDTGNDWLKYGRNREDAPYGSAVIPHDFDFYSSPPIAFRNQYSDRNRQTVFAGRPYGCDGTSCANIGQCSLNPNVFCIYESRTLLVGSKQINSDSCAKGGYGTCVTLWRGYYNLMYAKSIEGPPSYQPFFEYPLKTMFLKTFSAFDYDYEENVYKSEAGYQFTNSDYMSNIPKCDGNTRTNPDEFCAVWPTIPISSVRLWQGSQITNSISSPGIYSLTFNSNIDIEQQPLKEIKINWGDGTVQIINNQIHRPTGSSPHRIYHYYQSPGPYTITVEIKDNWGFYDNESRNID